MLHARRALRKRVPYAGTFDVIAVSSIRPFSASAEHKRNQIEAWRTWQAAFTSIVYFSKPEPEIQNLKTAFCIWEPFPRLMDLAKFLASQTDWGCIINADIRVGRRFPLIIERLKKKRGALAASSWRYEIEPTDPNWESNGRVVDHGLDFFCATPRVWGMVYEAADPRLRLGAQFWDTWTLSFFNTVASSGFYGLTQHRLIFHPKHGDRKYGPGPDHRDIPIHACPLMPYITV